MVVFNVNVTSDLLIQKMMHEKKLAKSYVSLYKTVGLRTVARYFKEINKVWIDKDDIKSYLEHQYEIYKDDLSLNQRWKLIRRSAELLVYFATTENTDMPPLPKWTKRDCLLYIEPNKEQLADNENIYGLTWRTRAALKKLGYADRTLSYYDGDGFLKILEGYKQKESDTYSNKINAFLILEAQERVLAGKQYRFQAIRKAVALLDEFHRYGTLTPSRLDSFVTENLSPEFEQLIDEYANDAILRGKLRPRTTSSANSMIKCFLARLQEHGLSTFRGVTPAITNTAIVKSAQSHYKGGAGSLLHYVRDFLSYLYEYNYTELDLSVAIPKMAAPAAKIYQGFSDNEIRSILAAVNRATAIGKRDYAILMLAAQTGLRSVDVVNLKRSDIDWRKKEIHIIQSKTGEPLDLAMENESGNAIFDYLINARPKCLLPNVFLCSNHPLRAVGHGVIHGIVEKYVKLAEISLSKHQRCGLHSFRRAFGTRLLENDTPVQLLSQLLGHRKIDSARPYMSASEKELKKCCLSLNIIEVRGNL